MGPAFGARDRAKTRVDCRELIRRVFHEAQKGVFAKVSSMPQAGDTSPPTLRGARARYFEQAGLGSDGGYAAPWVRLKLGPVPFAFPNTAARVRAVRYHDLHHVLTGYATDWIGECEISAWEIAGGCRRFVAAWVLNLFAFSAGCILAPRRTFRAFVRGRHAANLYSRADLDEILDLGVDEVRGELDLSVEASVPRPWDWAAFLAWFLLSILHASIWLLVLVGLPFFIVFSRFSSPGPA